MSNEQRRNAAERAAGSVPGVVYIGVYLLIGIVGAVIVGALTGSGIGALVVIAVAVSFGAYRAFSMQRYRRAYQEEKRTAE